MHLPARNALLTSITRPAAGGPVDDFDTATPVDATVVWAGNADAWVVRKNVRLEGAGRLDYEQEVSVSIPSALPVEVGDTLHLRFKDVDYAWEVRTVWKSWTVAAECVVNA